MAVREDEPDLSGVRASIRDRYSLAAERVSYGLEVTSGKAQRVSIDDEELLETGPHFGSVSYSARELARLPPGAVRASLGCGSPTADAPLEGSPTVLDAGCGGGIDSILAAQIVGGGGRVVGVDFSHAMVDLAHRNGRAAGAKNVDFLTALIEDLPLQSRSVDVVISNSSIHLSIDKQRVLAELQRVLVPGGKLHVVDIIAADDLSMSERGDRVPSTNTTAGILSWTEYHVALNSTGFTAIEIQPRQLLADRVVAGLVTAAKPLVSCHS